MSKIGKIKNTEKKQIVEKEYTEEFSFKNFVWIIIVILVVLGTFYFITTLVAKDKTDIKNNNISSSVIKSDMTTISSMLTKKEKDYYVLAYKQESGKKNNYDVYNMYIKDIMSKNSEFKLYKVNLSDAINKTYISDENNITNNMEEFEISDEILLHIVNNSIQESFIGLNEISNKLNELKGE